MKKYLIVFLSICLLVSGSFLTGCGAGPEETSSENSSRAEESADAAEAKTGTEQMIEAFEQKDENAAETAAEETEPQIWEETIEENLRAQFQIPEQVSELPVLDLAEAELDVEERWKRFSQKEGVLEVTEIDSGDIYMITDTEGGSLSWSASAFYYRSRLGKDIDNIVPRDLVTGDPEQERYETELSGLSRAEAEEQIRERIREMLPEVQVEEVRIYALSADTLREYREKLNDPEYYALYVMKPTELKDEWNAEDEVYYFETTFSLNGCPVMDYSYVMPDDTFTKGLKSYGYIGKNGLELFDLGDMVFQVEESEMKEVIPWEQAYQTVKDYYSLIINTHPLKIDEMSLEYVVMPLWDGSGRATLAPVWRVHVEMEDWPEFLIEEYVNALTGEKMN